MRNPRLKRKQFPAEKARRVKILILDVDGVMTDGKIIVSESAGETKNYSVYDGVGITLGMKQGLKFAFLSARESAVTGARAEELGVEDVFQVDGSKIPAYEAILEKHGLDDSEAAYMGDDIHDLDVMKRAGLAAAPANAVSEAALCADYITGAAGGEGAVREMVELILESKGKKLSLLPLFFFFLFAVLSGCSQPPETTPPPAPGTAPPPPAETVEGGFRYTATGKGAVIMEIEGDRAWGLSEAEPAITIENPVVKRRLEGGGVKASGTRGTFEKDTMNVIFEDDANIEYESGSGVAADRIRWIMSESKLEAEGSVEGVFYFDFEAGGENGEDNG